MDYLSLKQIVPSPVIISFSDFMFNLIEPLYSNFSVSTTALFIPSFSQRQNSFCYDPFQPFYGFLNKLPFENFPDCHYPLIIMISDDKIVQTPKPFYLFFTMSPQQYPFQYMMKPDQMMIELLFSIFVQDWRDDYQFLVTINFFFSQLVLSSMFEFDGSMIGITLTIVYSYFCCIQLREFSKNSYFIYLFLSLLNREEQYSWFCDCFIAIQRRSI